VHVHETITRPGRDLVLLYPQWLPGTHSPQGPLDRLAGLVVRQGAQRLPWRRDPLQPYAFHVAVPLGAEPVEVDFDYLSPTSSRVGKPEQSRNIAILEWTSLALYPAGHYARRIPVEASLTLPEGWHFGTALEVREQRGATTEFRATDLDTFLDSPVYAGRHYARHDLDPGSARPVTLHLFADDAPWLAATPQQIEAHRALVRQADRLFGARHYAHYDFLLSLSDQVEQIGLEHHQSSEDGDDPGYFTDWERNTAGRELLPHEYTHSWNGKFRRPADLWTPGFEVPMQNSLLWVYEGQTQYWGHVLAARAGLWSAQQARDALALVVAEFEGEAGRRWRSLADTGQDEVINPRRPQSWTSWQRFEDYYSEGQLIWLDVDTLIRERSGGRRSLDDFALQFFGVADGRVEALTYTFEELVRALNAVEPYDWVAFLRARVDTAGVPVPVDGIVRGGYRLVYGEEPTDYLKASDAYLKCTTLSDSIGIVVDDKESTIEDVRWESAAFQAGLTEGMQILAVDGNAYSADGLRQAIRSAHDAPRPIELIVRSGDRFRVVAVDYRGGLRYPRLERDPARPALLDSILAPRT
jgi:predicted metalloprotease with PDZ domain